MRKVLLLVVTLVSLCSYAQKGEKSVNLQLGYGTEIKNVGLGAKFAYNVTDAIRLAPSFDYFFKKDLSAEQIKAAQDHLHGQQQTEPVKPLSNSR